jgi:hypothetical protein
LEDAAKKIEDFSWEYNHFRPHSSINGLTPKEFIILHDNTPETRISVVEIVGRGRKIEKLNLPHFEKWGTY